MLELGSLSKCGPPSALKSRSSSGAPPVPRRCTRRAMQKLPIAKKWFSITVYKKKKRARCNQVRHTYENAT